MLTPAQSHWQKVMASRRGEEGMTSEALTAYEQVLHRLRFDQARLSDLQSARVRQSRMPQGRNRFPRRCGWFKTRQTGERR
ncbi:hypothetical protein [Xenorhabdus bovienii]